VTKATNEQTQPMITWHITDHMTWTDAPINMNFQIKWMWTPSISVPKHLFDGWYLRYQDGW